MGVFRKARFFTVLTSALLPLHVLGMFEKADSVAIRISLAPSARLGQGQVSGLRRYERKSRSFCMSWDGPNNDGADSYRRMNRGNHILSLFT